MTEHRLAAGDVAPDFTLADADGAKVSLSDYRGKRVIIYFYPARRSWPSSVRKRA